MVDTSFRSIRKNGFTQYASSSVETELHATGLQQQTSVIAFDNTATKSFSAILQLILQLNHFS